MSEYQFYDFHAIDRRLADKDRAALRDISSRARITATSFTNDYQWGDLKADPADLMARWFDAHVYVANWGSRRLMLRFPEKRVDRARMAELLRGVESATLTQAGENLILDIGRDEIDPDEFEDFYTGNDNDSRFGDDAGHITALLPLRDDVLSGDLRLFYLLWLIGVELEDVEDDEPEPLPGLGPLSDALEAVAEFFCIDIDLVAAAAERNAFDEAPMPPDAARLFVSSLSEPEKTAVLMRVFDGDERVGPEMRADLRNGLRSKSAAAPPRTAGELRAAATARREARERAEEERRAAEERARAEAAEKARRERLTALRRRGEAVWRDVEAEIERRNAGAYDRAIALLGDLAAIAAEQGTAAAFATRLRDMRTRHAKKGRFIERLTTFGVGPDFPLLRE